MSWLASPLWNLFYVVWPPILIGYAYYSRTESIQKLALCWCACYLGTNAVLHTEYELAAFLAGNSAALIYALILHTKFPTDRAIRWVCMLFMAIIGNHLHRWHFDSQPWLVYQIAYNGLGMAQCVILMVFGKRYGRMARLSETPRNDPFHRFALLFRG